RLCPCARQSRCRGKCRDLEREFRTPQGLFWGSLKGTESHMSNHAFERINPLRKPKGFEPVVQRWSAGLPRKCGSLCIAFHGVQGADAQTIYKSGFMPWISEAICLPSGPDVHDHAWFVDQNGLYTHIVSTYWVEEARRDNWLENPRVASWWNDSARLSETNGYFRESLTVPAERLETLYWNDYPAGLSRSNEVALYPTL